LKKLVENLIDASRIETGKLLLKLSVQNISNLVRECVDEMKYLTYNRKQSINITLTEKSEYIDIRIKDNGIGLTEKEKEIIFEKFGKIERYGMDLGVDIEGSGLGLYISKEIIELHDGQILVESKGRNKGALFTIRLFKKD
jgi:signal transduction histidine kinase